MGVLCCCCWSTRAGEQELLCSRAWRAARAQKNLVNALGGATFDLFLWSCWCISQVLMLLSWVLEDDAPCHGQGVGLSELQPWGDVAQCIC